MRWVLILLVVVPLVELFLLLWIDSLIGLLPTIAITLVTGFVGGTLAKREGTRVWRSWRAAIEDMSTPEQGVIDGVLVLLGGALLITPGVLTDVVGFSLLIPPSRRFVARRVRAAIDRRMAAGAISVMQSSSFEMSDDSFGHSDFDRNDLGHGDLGSQVVETEGEALSSRSD